MRHRGAFPWGGTEGPPTLSKSQLHCHPEEDALPAAKANDLLRGSREGCPLPSLASLPLLEVHGLGALQCLGIVGWRGAAVSPPAQAWQVLPVELMDGLCPWGAPEPPCLPHFPSELLLWRLHPAWNSCPREGRDTWRAASEAMSPQAPGKRGPADFQGSRAAPVLLQLAALLFPLQTERLLPSQWCSSWDPGALASPP